MMYLQHEFTGYPRLKADRITLQYTVMEHNIYGNLNEHDNVLLAEELTGDWTHLESASNLYIIVMYILWTMCYNLTH